MTGQAQKIETCFPSIQLTPHFKSEEFACPCGCSGGWISVHLVQKLETLRGRIGLPFKVLSGFRCADHNRAQGGAHDSMHLTGRAADIYVLPMTGQVRYNLMKEAIGLGFAGIGIRRGSIHLDTRVTPGLWTYGEK